MAPLPLDELLVLLAVEPVSVADPVALPAPLDGVELELELELELEFIALAWKASKVLLLFALTAKTIPFMQ